MLHVRTEVKKSAIHGLGLFSTREIKAGEIVWTFHPKIDHSYTPAFLDTIPKCVAEQLSRYCYVNPENPELLIVCGDDARFMNFQERDEPGSSSLALGGKFNGEYVLIAARDIAAGEELTVPLESDADAARKLSQI